MHLQCLFQSTAEGPGEGHQKATPVHQFKLARPVLPGGWGPEPLQPQWQPFVWGLGMMPYPPGLQRLVKRAARSTRACLPEPLSGLPWCSSSLLNGSPGRVSSLDAWRMQGRSHALRQPACPCRADKRLETMPLQPLPDVPQRHLEGSHHAATQHIGADAFTSELLPTVDSAQETTVLGQTHQSVAETAASSGQVGQIDGTP